MIADHVRAELVRLVADLRDAGVAVPADGALAAADALAALDDPEKAGVRTALRATLCTRPADVEALDARFETFWARLRGADAAYGDDDTATLGTSAEGAADAPGQTVSDVDASVGGAPGDGLAGGVGTGDGANAGDQYSADGASERVSLDGIGEVDVSRAVAALTDAVASLPGRRWTGGDGRPDVRRALRANASRGGVPLSLPERERERSAARGVVLVDVSGSVIDALDRDALLAFCREVRARWRRTPVFFFDTALRDVSAAFDADSPEAAGRALEAGGVEWGGGTRIGDALATLHDERSAAVGRRDTVVVVSDGVERGDTSRLRDELAWLSGRARCVLWLNPLAADPQWRPVAPGIRAALDYVDGCYAFADADDLAALADDLARHGPTLRAVADARRQSF
ncbi:VWA domain-containing protein [Halarchaeum grantii]|uniref:VWA domain-containing protein n=1 Tax=Halarchaeum grantii TaxID=1193105 RepID=A0A830FAW6_9EURY|nr:VWA domain-containing protein [Halarchaeum grantii]GGL28407.1 VWA domain-containing protein [Halarchaeum grantii]